MEEAPKTPDAEWLVNRIAHALRNSVFAMTLQAETLALQCDDPAASTLLAQLEHVGRLVEDMLLYGRPAQPQPRRLSLGALFNSLAADGRQGSYREPAAVQLEIEAPGYVVNWDADIVRAALEKILINAVEHTPAPHEILLRVGLRGAWVHVDVVDHGEGMTSDLVETAFLPFHPQHSGRAGLGLAIAHKLLRESGGSISIESQPGRGTAVHIRLPLESPA